MVRVRVKLGLGLGSGPGLDLGLGLQPGLALGLGSGSGLRLQLRLGLEQRYETGSTAQTPQELVSSFNKGAKLFPVKLDISASRGTSGCCLL